jgi:hypothetical protein
MLLKILRYTDKQKFWLLDDIRRISVSEAIRLDSSGDIGYLPDIIILDTLLQIKCECDGVNNRCSDCKDYIGVNCRMNNGDEISVVFDTIAYVLNDSGKTIEKIVANYNK